MNKGIKRNATKANIFRTKLNLKDEPNQEQDKDNRVMTKANKRKEGTINKASINSRTPDKKISQKTKPKDNILKTENKPQSNTNINNTNSKKEINDQNAKNKNKGNKTSQVSKKSKKNVSAVSSGIKAPSSSGVQLPNSPKSEKEVQKEDLKVEINSNPNKEDLKREGEIPQAINANEMNMD